MRAVLFGLCLHLPPVMKNAHTYKDILNARRGSYLKRVSRVLPKAQGQVIRKKHSLVALLLFVQILHF